MPALYQHRAAIISLTEQPQIDQDLKETLTEAIQSLDDVIAAPNRPFVRNFEAQTEVEKVREPTGAASNKNVHGFSLKQWLGELTKEELEQIKQRKLD